MRNTNLVFLLISLLAIGLTAAEPAVRKVLADEPEAVAGNSLTPEQKTALAAVDARLAGVEAIAAKIDDPDYKAEVARQIEDLKKTPAGDREEFRSGPLRGADAFRHQPLSGHRTLAQVAADSCNRPW